LLRHEIGGTIVIDVVIAVEELSTVVEAIEKIDSRSELVSGCKDGKQSILMSFSQIVPGDKSETCML